MCVLETFFELVEEHGEKASLEYREERAFVGPEWGIKAFGKKVWSPTIEGAITKLFELRSDSHRLESRMLEALQASEEEGDGDEA